VDVSKRPQRVAAACTWLVLAFAVIGILAAGPDIGTVSINQAALFAGLGVVALGAAVMTAISLTELHHPLLQPTGLVVDLGRLIYLGGVTGVLVAAHGIQTPLWVLFVPVLLTTAFIDVQWKALAYGVAASGLTALAVGITHGFAKASAVPLLLILAALPAVVAATSTFAQSINALAGLAETERIRQAKEVEELREQLIEGHRASAQNSR
jgi:hypothetical protein